MVCLCLLSRLFRFIVPPFQTAMSAQLCLFSIHFISLNHCIDCLRLLPCFRHFNFSISNQVESCFFLRKKSKNRIQDLWYENYMRKCDFNHRFIQFLSYSFDCFSYVKQRQNALVRYPIITAIHVIKIPIGNEFLGTASSRHTRHEDMRAQSAMNHHWKVVAWVSNAHKFGSAVRILDTAHAYSQCERT